MVKKKGITNKRILGVKWIFKYSIQNENKEQGRKKK